jgi:hypothetical protein
VTAAAVAFRFDAGTHEYIGVDSGLVYPHITGLLQRAGLVDDRWFTDDASQRGQAVHRLTADYDLGALEQPHATTSAYKAWLLGHVAMMTVVRPTFLHIEEPHVSPRYGFAGQPDRILIAYGQRGTWEIKAAVPQRSHQIQTALQAILDEDRSGIPAEHAARWCEYLKPTGGARVVEHKDRRDVIEARRIIARFC